MQLYSGFSTSNLSNSTLSLFLMDNDNGNLEDFLSFLVTGNDTERGMLLEDVDNNALKITMQHDHAEIVRSAAFLLSSVEYERVALEQKLRDASIQYTKSVMEKDAIIKQLQILNEQFRGLLELARAEIEANKRDSKEILTRLHHGSVLDCQRNSFALTTTETEISDHEPIKSSKSGSVAIERGDDPEYLLKLLIQERMNHASVSEELDGARHEVSLLRNQLKLAHSTIERMKGKENIGQPGQSGARESRSASMPFLPPALQQTKNGSAHFNKTGGQGLQGTAPSIFQQPQQHGKIFQQPQHSESTANLLMVKAAANKSKQNAPGKMSEKKQMGNNNKLNPFSRMNSLLTRASNFLNDRSDSDDNYDKFHNSYDIMLDDVESVPSTQKGTNSGPNSAHGEKFYSLSPEHN